MPYKTINVKEETYEKLIFYKHGGMSFDDVLNELMDIVPEKKFYRIVLQEHRQRMEAVHSGDYSDSEDLNEALKKI